MSDDAKYGDCGVAASGAWHLEQYCVSSGYTVVWKSAGEAGKFLLDPTFCGGGATNCTWVPVPPTEATAQLLIQVVRLSPQALGSASQQLCPPLTLVTIIEVDGCWRLTTVLACA